MSYIKYGVNLSDGQKDKLARALSNKSAITIRLTKSDLTGSGQTGGFLIPQNKIDQLIKYKDLLTKKQTEQIVSAIHTGGQLVVKPTKTQSGGFLGTLLASIGVPLLLNALTGKGLQVDKQRSRRSVNVHVPKVLSKKTSTANKDGGLILPQNWRSPPFYGDWPQTNGMG